VRGIAMGARGAAAALSLTLLAGAAAAQEAGPPSGFVLARYASRSALGFYAGYPAGPGLAVVGMIQNPRTQYREAIVGVGAQLLTSPAVDVLGTVALANTSDGWFTQLYVLPSWQAGPVAASATLEAYLPLGRSGARELDVAPATALVALSRTFGVGGTWVLSAPAGARARSALGPAVRVAIPRGTVRLDLLRGFGGGTSEVRVTVQCAWR
jgi:hypothetical protein